MRITQCHISKSVSDFPWLGIYGLDDYRDSTEPCVFFGMYRYEDMRLLVKHRGIAVVFWTGQDVLQEKWRSEKRVFRYRNVTAHPKVAKYIAALGYECELVAPSSFLNDFWPQPVGTKIYAYCPSSAPVYHGSEVLEELRRGGYDIVTGDGSITQAEWRSKRDYYYNDIAIGLCLSSFAGGGTSIIEMGLRGIKVVTNVFDLPHTLHWADVGDVEQSAYSIVQHIDAERTKVGTTNKNLARDVYDSLDHEFNWLNI